MALLACQQWAAGTRLLEDESSSKPIEAFRSYEEFGDDCDRILTRDEHDPLGPLVRRRVLRRFVRTAELVALGVGGRTIETTAEHPFYVRGRGWTPAGELRPGAVLVSHDGQQVTLAEIASTGRIATVYNLEVEDCHTYFVGDEAWGFSVWAHNASCTWNEFQHETKGMWNSNREAGGVWRQIKGANGPHFSGAAKPWTKGARANSMYTQLNSSGQAMQTAIYNHSGDVIAHIDWKNHGRGALSGHWHVFPIAGNPASGHFPGAAHIPFDLQPPSFAGLPQGILPVTPIGT